MSRPGGPYRDEQYPPRRQPQQPYDNQQGFQRGYQEQGYQGQGYRDQGYDQGYDGGYDQGLDRGHDRGYDRGYDQGPDRGYGQQYERGYDQEYDQRYDRGYDRRYDQEYEPGFDRAAASQRPVPQRPAPERGPAAGYDDYDDDDTTFRLPGLGLVLSLLGLVVQILSFTVLPWMASSGGAESRALPAIWDLVKNFDARGFAGAYVVLFSYPLAVLGILLSLVAVLESVAMKVIWAALAIIGVGVLAVKYGFSDLFSGGGLNLSSREITFGGIALGVLVVVLVMLKLAMSTFRRLAGLVLLVIAGVHVYAVSDLSNGFGLDDIQLGAYGPAVGYVLAAAAAFIGPRRLT